jgi:hypothetical protein
VALLEAVTDRAADILETVAAETDGVSRTVFQADADGETIRRDYKAVLRALATISESGCWWGCGGVTRAGGFRRAPRRL